MSKGQRIVELFRELLPIVYREKEKNILLAMTRKIQDI